MSSVHFTDARQWFQCSLLFHVNLSAVLAGFGRREGETFGLRLAYMQSFVIVGGRSQLPHEGA